MTTTDLERALAFADANGHRVAREEVERLSRTLAAIANDGCGLRGPRGWCPDQTEDRDEWCWCCIARDTIGPQSQEDE